ncbi:MAG: type transport system ATP-binding protein [Thermoleophilaceae bacterium]|nr:type transport system ATP-binding protein [Thermoleophilaceae bacterium]
MSVTLPDVEPIDLSDTAFWARPPAEQEAAFAALRERFGVDPRISEGEVAFAVPGGEQFVPRLFAELGLPILSVNVSRPTLDDVFMSYTGSTIRDAEQSSAQARNRVAMQMFAGRR